MQVYNNNLKMSHSLQTAFTFEFTAAEPVLAIPVQAGLFFNAPTLRKLQLS